MAKHIYLIFVALTFGLTSFAQNGLSFDGTNDKVDLGNGAALQITGTAITVEAWIYPTSWRTNVWEGGIVVKEQNIHYGYMFRAGQSGRLNFAFGNGTTWKELTTSANALSLNTWQHVAATYDGSMTRLYKNGVVIDSIAYTGNMGTNSNSCVIGGWATTGRNFPGKIDEVRIWNVVRTTAEIANSMNGEFCGAPTGLAAYYKFNQGTAGGTNTGQTTLTDIVGNNNGTLQNFALTGSTSNWVTGKTLTPGTGGSATFAVTSCSSSYTSPSGNYVWTQSGQYMDTILSPLGCDSVLTINLTFGSPNMGTLTTSGCNTYTSPSGKYVWSSNGTYIDTITNVSGCDSVLTINLTINSIDTNVLQSGATLTSWATGVSYQWLDCNNNYAAVSGATSQTFKPTADGSYSVEVKSANCTDTSACYTVAGVGIEHLQMTLNIQLYPNPAKKTVTLKFGATIKKLDVEIVNTAGKIVAYYSFKNTTQAELDLNLPSGIYLTKVLADENLIIEKLMVE
jgi:hypothetical protein